MLGKWLGKMIVRALQERDIPACIHIGAAMHAESDFQDMEYSPEKCAELGRRVIADGNYAWFVAETDGSIAGMIGGYVCPSYFGHDKVAHDFLVYILPEFRGGRAFILLIRAFVAWAEEMGASKIHLANSAAITNVDKLYARLGFDCIGSIYRRNT